MLQNILKTLFVIRYKLLNVIHLQKNWKYISQKYLAALPDQIVGTEIAVESEMRNGFKDAGSNIYTTWYIK